MLKKAVNTETPFNERHCCWFCGEPHDGYSTFPVEHSNEGEHRISTFIVPPPHPALIVQSCNECRVFAKQASLNNIWAIRRFVKEKLLTTYAKHLAIGVNWTPKELANSDFEQGNFAGFARSAWFMYEVAKDRVNYPGWPLVIDGIELDEIEYSTQLVETFSFDGILYPSISEAVKYYCDIFYIDEQYFLKVLGCISKEKATIDQALFAKTVRFCRVLVNTSAQERNLAYQTLAKNLRV